MVANHSQTYNIDLTTSGPATVFRDGQRLDGTWTATADSPLRFTDGNGQEILLAPGQSWLEVVDTGVLISVS
ncbi:MAG: DUF3048 C-terminal domain-containing protein [Actinomycetia bacterium]|nr:DUF3048 C-terminal domain-containing protein [Actinomycetes bacterium]